MSDSKQPVEPETNNVVHIKPAPPALPWRKQLIVNGGGKPEKLLTNAVVPLRCAPEWKGVIRYNLFSHQIEMPKAPPWAKGTWKQRNWEQFDDFKLTEWLQRNNVLVGSNLVVDAVYTAAYENQYHPVQDYLNSLVWDGIPRLPGWLSRYLGAEHSLYHIAVGIRWMISGVARIMAPGPDCKADCVLILEGEQGIMKSTALRVLAGAWFLDDLRKFASRDSAMQLSGRWIVELAELTAMNEVTIESCKAFLSNSMDTIRLPYGRRVIDTARQCIFAASTNKNVFLRDETGDRRFWPIACTKIDIDALQLDRDQLWAEAYHLYRTGHKWWLETQELRALAEDEQGARFDADPWEPTIKNYLKSVEKTTPEQVLENLFSTDIQDITKSHRNRVSAVLRHLRWRRVRMNTTDNRGDYIWIPPQPTVIQG